MSVGCVYALSAPVPRSVQLLDLAHAYTVRFVLAQWLTLLFVSARYLTSNTRWRCSLAICIGLIYYPEICYRYYQTSLNPDNCQICLTSSYSVCTVRLDVACTLYALCVCTSRSRWTMTLATAPGCHSTDETAPNSLKATRTSTSTFHPRFSPSCLIYSLFIARCSRASYEEVLCVQDWF